MKCYLGEERGMMKFPCDLCLNHSEMPAVKCVPTARIIGTHTVASRGWICNLGHPLMLGTITGWKGVE